MIESLEKALVKAENRALHLVKKTQKINTWEDGQALKDLYEEIKKVCVAGISQRNMPEIYRTNLRKQIDFAHRLHADSLMQVYQYEDNLFSQIIAEENPFASFLAPERLFSEGMPVSDLDAGSGPKGLTAEQTRAVNAMVLAFVR